MGDLAYFNIYKRDDANIEGVTFTDNVRSIEDYANIAVALEEFNIKKEQEEAERILEEQAEQKIRDGKANSLLDRFGVI